MHNIGEFQKPYGEWNKSHTKRYSVISLIRDSETNKSLVTEGRPVSLGSQVGSTGYRVVWKNMRGENVLSLDCGDGFMGVFVCIYASKYIPQMATFWFYVYYTSISLSWLKTTFVLIPFLPKRMEVRENIRYSFSMISYAYPTSWLKHLGHHIETIDLNISSSNGLSWIKINGPSKILDLTYSLLFFSLLVFDGLQQVKSGFREYILKTLVGTQNSGVRSSALFVDGYDGHFVF